MVTRELGHDQLLAYLNRRITLAQLVDWAENVLCEGELQSQNSEILRDILTKIGLADVAEFGLSWDDCYNSLAQMGYRMEVEATPLATGAKRYDPSLHR
ncbi:MAG: hypothetical protein H8E35_01935 [Ardenticatenia bacterium]|nr:hypothetical protein [Ardenticatenia bacterium]